MPVGTNGWPQGHCQLSQAGQPEPHRRGRGRRVSGDDLAQSVRSRNRNRLARSPRSIGRFRACCTVHAPSGCALTARTWIWRAPASITKNTQARRKVTAQPAWKKIACQHRGHLRAQELPPRRAAALRRGRDPQPFQDPPHRRGADPVPEAEQFALDPLIAPAGVHPRHLPDQHHEPGVNWRPSSFGRIGAPPADQPPVPAQQRVWRQEPAPPQRPGEQAGQGSEYRAVCPVQPGPGVLPPQHRDLVAQHQQLGILRRRRTRQQRHPASQAHEDQVEHPCCHKPPILPALG